MIAPPEDEDRVNILMVDDQPERGDGFDSARDAIPGGIRFCKPGARPGKVGIHDQPGKRVVDDAQFNAATLAGVSPTRVSVPAAVTVTSSRIEGVGDGCWPLTA